MVAGASFRTFLLSEDEQGEECQRHHHDAHGDEGVGKALRGEAHQQQHGEAEGQRRYRLQHQVVGRRGLEARVYLAEQNHAVAGGAGEHAEHREEAFVDIARIEVLANPAHINESGEGTQSNDEHERQRKLAKLLEIDGSRASHNHDVEAETTDAVEHVVIDVLAVYDMCLLETLQNRLEENTEQRAYQEVESPKHGFQRVLAKLAQLHALNPVSEQINKEIDEQHHANLHRELVDGLGIGYRFFIKSR